jgi:hypothetical protein
MIVGICGSAGAGKDTIAEHLVRTYGFHIVRFADPLKDLVEDMFLIPRRHMDTLEFKERPDPRWVGPNGLPRTPREILQIVGTDGFRAVDPDYWVKLTKRRIDNLVLTDGVRRIVVPDVRFPNEAEMLQRCYGAEIWRVVKVGGQGTSHAAHASETELEKIEPYAVFEAEAGDIDGLLAHVEEHLTGVLS